MRNAQQERFDFLGYFGPHRLKQPLTYLSASPSRKSMHWFNTKLGNLLLPGSIEPWPELRDTVP